MPLNKTSTPLVSIVMGVHNEKDEHLRMAIDSICNQTYHKLEFIIVDDCSNEGCKNTLSEYEDRYSFIRVIHNETNLGLTKSLNIGFHQARGEFIARMDADDFSDPTRFAKQVEFLTIHPDIDICGTGVVSFGDSSMYMSPFKGISNEEAQCYLFFSSTLCHPSVMIRKQFLEENCLAYDENVKRGQDYDLWERASIIGKIFVMNEVLLFYRLHSAQITSSHKGEQDFFADRTRLRRISRLNIIPSEKEYSCHMLLSGKINTNIPISDVQLWIDKLLEANQNTGFVDQEVFKTDLYNRFAMFKLRNHHYFSLFNRDDLSFLWKAFSLRVQMKKSVNWEMKRFNYLIKNA